jgi:DNA polymerase III alpha subunit
VVEEGIRLGLLSIKNIGPAAASVIEEYRPFDSYEQIQQRCPAKALNVTGRASLVMSGACDRWGKRDEYTEDHIDQLERNLLGMSLTSVYSIAAYADAIEGRFWTEEEFESAEDGTRVAIVGEISNIKEHVDVKGNTMAFIDLVYGPNQWNCTLFASMYAEYHDLIHSRRPLLITGAKNTHKGKMGLKVEALPCDDDGEWVPPIMDLSQYVDMIGDQEEQLASDSVFPEDLQESIDDNLVTA